MITMMPGPVPSRKDSAMKRYSTLRRFAALLLASATLGCVDSDPSLVTAPAASISAGEVDAMLRGQLARNGFTGRIAETLELRLGRRIDRQLADLGRLLWFDPIQGLNDDNACAGCHS